MLEKVSLFSDLDPQEIAGLEMLGHRKVFAKNTIVIHEGDQSDSLYVVIDGRACAIRTDESGRQLIVNRFGPWDYFGEMSFFDRNARCATVITRTPCSVMILPRSGFQAFAARRPQLLWSIINSLLDKLRKATRQIEEMAFLDVYGRLVRFLLENQDEKGMVREKITQQELADIVGSTRETVSRILHQLRVGGYIARECGKIVILKKLPYKF